MAAADDDAVHHEGGPDGDAALGCAPAGFLERYLHRHGGNGRHSIDRVELRRLGPDDADLWRAAVARFADAAPAHSSEFLAGPTAAAVVAEDDGVPVGWAWGHVLARPDGESMLLLYELDVAADRRRRGIGTALTEEMMQIGRESGCREMWLVTEADNEAALATYGSAGGSWSEVGDTVVAWELDSK